MKTTVYEPAETITPSFGVLPIGLPLTMIFETGIELIFSVPGPSFATTALVVGAGVASGIGAELEAFGLGNRPHKDGAGAAEGRFGAGWGSRITGSSSVFGATGMICGGILDAVTDVIGANGDKS